MTGLVQKARNRAYVRKHVDNKKELGYTNTQVWLDKDGNDALNALKSLTGAHRGGKGQLISLALQHYLATGAYKEKQ